MTIENHVLQGDDITRIPCPKNNKKFAAGQPDTIIIHYTAGRSAESSANFLARDDVAASAHLVIGRQRGEVYQLVPFDTISWHAGKSQFGNRSGFNKFSIGIELDNAGPLTKVGNEFQAWFGKVYPANEALQAVHRNESAPRFWHTFSPQQIEACEEVCRLLLKDYPGINQILGHEEISPGRKVDPGPAFPLDKFRRRLLFEDRADDDDAGVARPSLPESGRVISNFLNIREGAGTSHAKIAQPLTKGAEVKILEDLNGWYKVKTEITGWVSKGFIDTSDSS